VKRTSILLVVLAVGACSRTPTPEAGELRVIPLAGEVNLLDGDDSSLLEEASTFDVGVNVATGADGWARVQLPGGRSMELAPESNLRVESASYEISDGSVLVRTDSPTTLLSGGAQIETTPGIFRVDRNASIRLATYRGEATVLGSAVDPVTTLREIVLQGGDVLTGIKPLEVSENDPWDNEILGAAIDLGGDLEEFERGLTRQLPTKGGIDAVARVLERTFSPREIQSTLMLLGSAAKVVVASVVAKEAARTDGVTESLGELLTRIANLQRDGAKWIVVVAELGLARAALVLTRELREIAAAAAELVAPPPAQSSSSSGQVGPRQTPSGGANPPGGSDNGNPSGNQNHNGGGTPDPPAPEPDPIEQPTCSSDVDCAVQDVLGDSPPGPPGTPGLNP
jgi:hypothetical protein